MYLLHKLRMGLVILLYLWSPFLACASHGISLYAPLKYQAHNFQHFAYVNPKAPKGGEAKIGLVGNFQQGTPYDLVTSTPILTHFLSCKLLSRSLEEPQAMYGQLAKDIIWCAKEKKITFKIHENAQWHSGEKITAPRLKNLLNKLKKTAHHPQLQLILSQIEDILCPAEETLVLKLRTGKIPLQQLPFMIGSIPLIENEQPLESAHCGPYKFAKMPDAYEAVLEKVSPFWGEHLPVNKGRFNFDRIVFRWYRTAFALIEAFKKGEVDFIYLTDPTLWQSTKTDLTSSSMISSFQHGRPVGMEAFVFNMRHPFFADKDTRKALLILFDFAWYNHHYYHDRYQRIESYFENTAFQSKTAGETVRHSLQTRATLHKAKALLQKGGWVLKDGRLYSPRHGQYFEITLLLPHFHYMKVAQSWAKSLEKVGIKLNIKRLETGLFEEKKRHFNFDLILHKWPLGTTPGHEILHYFSSHTANLQGGQNIAGIEDPVIDKAMHNALSAKSMQEKQKAFKKLDQLLCQGYYGVPLFYLPKDLIAHKKNLTYPKNTSFSPSLVVWWDKNANDTGEQKNVASSYTSVSSC